MNININNKKYNLLLGRFCLSKNSLIDAIKEAIGYNSNCLMIYLGSPQNSFRRNITDFEIINFRKKLIENNILLENVLVHAPYIINLGNKINENVFNWSVNFLIKEIELMKRIGLTNIIIHPGSSLLKSKYSESIKQISKGINIIIKNNNKEIKISLETACKKGGSIGWKLEHLKDIIENVDSIYKENIGICLDTCHLYSSGYDIKEKLDSFINDFEKIFGTEKIFSIHINDSKHELGKNIDRHENIGLGKIGTESLKKIVLHPKLDGIPKILETPRRSIELNLEEINLLKK